MKKIFFWCRNVACAGLHTEVGKMIILSLIINMIIECLNHRNLWGLAELFANPVVFLYNTSIIFLTLCIGFFATRKVFVYVMISAIWITLAVINFVVLSARKTPFTAMDIYLIKDAVKVLRKYSLRLKNTLKQMNEGKNKEDWVKDEHGNVITVEVAG